PDGPRARTRRSHRRRRGARRDPHRRPPRRPHLHRHRHAQPGHRLPGLPPPPPPSVAPAYLATLGSSAALRAREVTGRGQHVETSMLQAVILFAGTYWQRAEHPDAPAYDMHTVDRRQTWGLVNTRDRWVCSWAPSHEWAIASGGGDEIK